MAGVIYLSYNAGYLEPSASGRELSDDAIWLGSWWPEPCRGRRRPGDCWRC
jgi:hypothetical protein